jgi:hypothetical protein
MQYRKLGNTGLDISPICIGCMGFGDPSRGHPRWSLDEEASRPLIRHAIEAGINFFDTANIYKAFCDAKDATVKEYEHNHIFNNMATMFPWFGHLYEHDQAVLGKDWWPYGMEANRKAVELILRYHYEQRITDRLFKIEEIFVPELLNT